MKKILVVVLVFSFYLTAFSYFESKSVTASIEWKNTEYDFGKVEYNKPISVNFQFSNSSMIPLVISAVEPSCGCTVADFPKEPIKYGKNAQLTVTFDAKTTGYFKKSITVISNAAQSPSVLYISGEVVKSGD